ncbi:MAG: cytochrome c biogenesis protein CcsA [Acidimicrobiales bacterium]
MRSTGRSPAVTASAARRGLGLAALAGLVATVWLGLWVTPPDEHLGEQVRLLYIHPPVAWVAYLAFGVTAAASLLYLWRRSRSRVWDRLAAASAEIGVVFCGLTLISGSIWGKATWGVWWTWGARLTSTALLFVLYLGYLALRRVPSDPDARAKRSAVAAIFAFADVPISYLSVYWWRTLHQTGTVLDPEKQVHVHGSMAWTLLIGFVAFTLAYGWLLAHRYRVAALEDRMEDEGLALAIEERLAEAAPAPAAPVVGEREVVVTP